MDSLLAVTAAGAGTVPAAPASTPTGWMLAARERLGLAGPPSARRTVIFALAIMVLLASVSALATRQMLSARIHDYAILNLAGQLREMAGAMTLDARQAAQVDLVDPVSAREIASYRDRLTRKVAQFDRIVDSFESRSLTPDLTGLDAPVSCSWDPQSLRQLKATADAWRSLRLAAAPGLLPGASDAAVRASADTLTKGGDAVLESSRQLSVAFKTMMQSKLDMVIALQALAVLACAVAAAGLLMWLRRRVLEPLKHVERGALRLMNGKLGEQVPTSGDRELAAVAEALNRLSSRLHLLFDVAERTNAGMTTSDLLDTLRDALQPVVPVDLIGVAVRSADDPRGWRMHRTAGVSGAHLSDGAVISAGHRMPELTAALAAAAAASGFGAALVVPLQDSEHEASALLFATRNPAAIPDSAQALLRTVAGPVRAQLDRTLSTEALVVAAVEGLAKLAESRDPETGDHLVRMSAYSAMLGAALTNDPDRSDGIDARYIEDLRRFAPMHDIGKVGIADSILLKPGRLTDDERAAMMLHPKIGADVLQRCEAQMLARGRSVFRTGIDIALAHHERWDGTGYPNQTAGSDIPLSARIVAVADVFDALTSKRPYKQAWPVERALAAIDADAGKHFDPAIVAALHRCLPEVLAFYAKHKHV